MPANFEMLFPSYIRRGRLNNSHARKLNKELAREIQTLERIDDHGRDWSATNYVGGYSSYSSMCHLQQTSPTFQELERRLQPHVQAFIRKLNWNLMGGRIRMTTCWANSMGQGTYHTLHIHPLSVLSGVYYVNAPKGSSPLKLEDPRMNLFMSSPPRRQKAPTRDQNYLLIEPHAGSFVLFESWMRHEVPPHRGRDRRLSVSFNYGWS